MENDAPVLEFVNDTQVIGAQERALIDVQIATAKRFPRVPALVKKEMLDIATLDAETAQTCFYTLPKRQNNGGGESKPIQGPSVRLAEIALTCFGNVRLKTQIIGDDGKFITAESVGFDLEKNVAVSTQVRRRVTTKDGRRYSDDMVSVTCQAACSIAARNVTFKIVPLALIKPVYDAAMKVAIGDAKSLSDRRAKAFESFAKMGIARERVLSAIGKAHESEVGLDQLGELIGFHTAIREGSAKVDEIFPEPSNQPKKPLFNKPKEASTAPDLKPAGEPLKPWQELAVSCGDAGLSEADVMAYAFEKGAEIDLDENQNPFLKFSALSDKSATAMIDDFANIEKAVNAKKGGKK